MRSTSAPSTPREAERHAGVQIRPAPSARSRFGLPLDDSASYRNVILELLDGIAATDGAKLKPWQLTFVFGAQ